MTMDRDAALDLLTAADSRTRLRSLAFQWTAEDASVAAACRFRSRHPDAAPIIGCVGGASSGKSTLFNSLLDAPVSLISGHAHETRGPILAVGSEDATRVGTWMQENLLFPDLAAEVPPPDTPVAGSHATIQVHVCPDQRLRGVVLVDLPDITSRQSAAEGALATTLLPWFDGVLAVADEERWFDAVVFEQTLGHVRAYAPVLWVVYNQTERLASLDLDERARLTEQARACGARDSVLCPFQPGVGYRPVAHEVRSKILDWLQAVEQGPRGPALNRALQARAGALVAENVERTDRFQRLVRGVEDAVDRAAEDTRLSLDLLTAEERRVLGLGYRFVPLYDALNLLRRRAWGSGKGHARRPSVDFDKREQALADALAENFALRFRRVTDQIDALIAAHAWPGEPPQVAWTLPLFDAADWSHRIRAHIDAWQAEAQQQARRGDVAALSVGAPLLLADLLFLGGAGVTLSWAAVWVTGLLGGKGLARFVQKSPSFQAYRATVRSYQATLREALRDQWDGHRAALPVHHFRMDDPLLSAIMKLATPGDR